MAGNNLEFNFMLVTPAEYAKASRASYKEVLNYAKQGSLKHTKQTAGSGELKFIRVML